MSLWSYFLVTFWSLFQNCGHSGLLFLIQILFYCASYCFTPIKITISVGGVLTGFHFCFFPKVTQSLLGLLVKFLSSYAKKIFITDSYFLILDTSAPEKTSRTVLPSLQSSKTCQVFSSHSVEI